MATEDRSILQLPDRIDTARLQLRVLEEGDLDALFEVNGDERVTRFLPYATWRTSADGRSWYERTIKLQDTGTAVQFVLRHRQLDRAIGTCLVFRHEAESRRAELGYVLGRAYWGQGYMREALAALIDSVLGGGCLRRLEAEIDPRNLASARLIEGLGFTREGLLRQRWFAKGEVRDVNIYGLLDHEWSAGTRPAPVGVRSD